MYIFNPKGTNNILFIQEGCIFFDFYQICAGRKKKARLPDAGQPRAMTLCVLSEIILKVVCYFII